MTYISATLKNSENYKRFVKVRSRLAAIALLIFLISLSFHSSTANHFSAQASFIDLAIIGLLVGGLLFAFGTAIAASILIPSVYSSRRSSSQKFSPSEEPSFATHQDDFQPHQRDDWYNDATNPASPVYKAIHDSHREH